MPLQAPQLRIALLLLLACVTLALVIQQLSPARRYRRDPAAAAAAVNAHTAANDDVAAQVLAICAAVKDEHAYIREWIAHHKHVGVGRFYVIDHGSSPPLRGVLSDHIATGLVQYSWWDPGNFMSQVLRDVPAHYMQMDMYDDCLRRHGHKHRFMAFIDVDEFFIIRAGSPGGGGLPSLLRHFQRFDDFGGLAVHWRLFGTSGHVQKPGGGMLQAYTRCIPLNGDVNGRLVKSIVDTRFATGCLSAHHFGYNSSMYAVNERFQRVDGDGSDPQTGRWIVLNHYITRSQQEFAEKMQRGSASGIVRDPGFAAHIDNRSTEDCLGGTHYGPYI